MGFGSYDESEQEQPGENEQEDVEAVDKDGGTHEGEDTIEDEDVDDMMGHL